jgi:hypothetical protein
MSCVVLLLLHARPFLKAGKDADHVLLWPGTQSLWHRLQGRELPTDCLLPLLLAWVRFLPRVMLLRDPPWRARPPSSFIASICSDMSLWVFQRTLIPHTFFCFSDFSFCAIAACSCLYAVASMIALSGTPDVLLKSFWMPLFGCSLSGFPLTA